MTIPNCINPEHHSASITNQQINCRFDFNPIPFGLTMKQLVVDRKHNNATCSKSWKNQIRLALLFQSDL